LAKAKNPNNKTDRYDEIAKDIEIKKEIVKLNKLFKDMDIKIKKAVSSTIENVAFMTITLRELQKEINKNGAVTTYQNGENQYGTKKSPEVDIYNTMIKNYISAMKTLTDLLPKNSNTANDGFMEFLNNK